MKNSYPEHPDKKVMGQVCRNSEYLPESELTDYFTGISNRETVWRDRFGNKASGADCCIIAYGNSGQQD